MKVRPLMQFIPAITPRYTSPEHLAPFVRMLERATCEPVRGICSVPPRHEKSDTVDHAVARMLLEDPARRVGLAMYGQRPAEKRGRRIREIYQRGGGRVLGDASSKSDWRTGAHDGGLWSTSIGGPVTGEGFDVFVIDDPVKDRVHAESALERERLHEWFGDVAYTRLEPGGSCLVIAARWHPDDLIGRLERDGWEYVNLPAVDAQGRALLPSRYPLPALERIRETIGAYGWQSLYQGNPYSRGGTLFVDVHQYEALPADGMVRFHIGVDFAYTKKTKADWSVAVVLAEAAGSFFVVEVVRAQLIAPDFKKMLDALAVRYPGVRPFAFVGGQEKGVVDLMNAQGGIQIETEPATQDKFLRAQGVAAQWNQGRVLVPRAAPWLDAFVSEVVGFTGSGATERDDQVDALAGAFERVRVDRTDVARREYNARHRADLADQFRRGEAQGNPAWKAEILAEDMQKAREFLRRDDVRERIERERVADLAATAERAAKNSDPGDW